MEKSVIRLSARLYQKITRLMTLALLLATAANAWAQSNGLNSMYAIEFGDFTSNIVQKEANAADVAIAVVKAITKTDDTSQTINSERVGEVIEGIKGCLPAVRRFTLGGGQPEMKRLLTGSVDNIVTNKKTEETKYKRKDGTVSRTRYDVYTTRIAATINIYNPNTGKTNTKNFNVTGESRNNATPDKAFSAALDQLRSAIVKHYNTILPIRANIIEISKLKKDKLKEVCIDVGSRMGVNYDLSFYVYEIGQHAGKETTNKIGRVKIEEVMGDDISLCKVKSGAKEIKEKIDAGATNLILVSTEETFSLF